MAVARIVLCAVLVLGGVAVLIPAWRGLRGTLPRNRFAGVRTPATMRSAEAFRLGNQVAAPATLAAAGALVLAGACLPFLATTASFVIVLVIGLVGALALTLVGGVLGNRAAAAMPEPAGACAGCPGGGCATLLRDSTTACGQ